MVDALAVDTRTHTRCCLLTDRHSLVAEHETKAKEKWDRAYAAGYGTVVFYEDPAAVEAKLGHKPGDVFEAWTKNAQGMLQFTIWNALELEGGMGANLQHFHQEDPNVAAAIRELLKIPARWEVSGVG